MLLRTTIVYLCVLVFRINKHDGWKVLIYEIQIKKIHYLSSSRWNGRQCLDRALQIHISSYSFWHWIVSSLKLISSSKIQFISKEVKYCGNYLNQLQFPNSKKNSFCMKKECFCQIDLPAKSDVVKTNIILSSLWRRLLMF